MRKTLKQTLIAAALAATGLAAQAAGTLAITPASTTVDPGESFVVDLRGVGFDEATFGGGASLSWNPDVIDLTSVSIDATEWSFARSTGLLDAASGTLSDLYAVTFTPKIGDFLIARLTFTADRTGTTALNISASPDQPFSNELEEAISLRFDGAQVTVTAVPEPGTWALMVAGLAALPWLRRRTTRR